MFTSEWQLQCVGFQRDEVIRGEFPSATFEHLMRKVCATKCAGASHTTTQSRRHVAGTAAEIEDLSIWLAQDMDECSRSAPPPDAIHIQREQMIRKVVSRRNFIEHLLHRPGGRFLIDRTLGSSACALELFIWPGLQRHAHVRER